ncbi:hypothetical protein AOLI_G00083560 [Acnodon oligacanthus]
MKKAPLWEASESIVPLWRDICTVQTRERWKGRDLPMSTNSWQTSKAITSTNYTSCKLHNCAQSFRKPELVPRKFPNKNGSRYSSLVPTRQMAGLTPVSSPASMRHPVSENQMNHFHCTDALLTDRLSRPRSSTLLALELTARSEEPALWLSPGRSSLTKCVRTHPSPATTVHAYISPSAAPLSDFPTSCLLLGCNLEDMIWLEKDNTMLQF